MKSIAIMQPYFLPYIGYFQLMAAVDKFVVFDDVSFINRGWINRNRLLLDGQVHTFTMPLRNASQNRLICEIELDDGQPWRNKLISTIRHAYHKAPHFSEVSDWVEHLIRFPSHRLDEFLLNGLHEVARYLALDVEIVDTSRVYRNAELRGQARILDICDQERAGLYVNAIGGIELYDSPRFMQQGVTLKFLQPRQITYSQGGQDYYPWLSILDVLMFNDRLAVSSMLGEADFIQIEA